MGEDMAWEVKMPSLGLSIVEGTIEQWLKREGDPIRKGDPIVSITTEKVSLEIPAEFSGVLRKILCAAGTKANVGQTIALIEVAGEAGLEAPGAPMEIPPPDSEGADRVMGGSRLKVSPLARKMAEEYGLDIQEVVARFPGEKIGKKEILNILEEKKVEKERKRASESIPEEGEVRPLSGALRAMAEHMSLSTRTAARVTTMAEVDMTELVKVRQAWKERVRKENGANLTFVPFVIRAICRGVREFPILNAALRGEALVFHRRVNIGVAVDAGETLVVPVIQDAAAKGIIELSLELSHLAQRARSGKLRLEDVQEGTISLTNAGVYGALLSTPLIHQPQSAILWMGKIMDTPVVREGQIVIRSMMYLCLSYDHRIITGAQGIRFLQLIKNHLEEPLTLLPAARS